MKKYGLIGYPLSHSFSKKFFAEKFAAEKITDKVYDNYQLTDLSELSSLLNANADLAGINVTIPYKESVLDFLTAADDIVKQIGACNCITIREGCLVGYNTDVYGFGRSLRAKLQPNHNRALILGTGGASKAVRYVLEQSGIPFHFVSRAADPYDPLVLNYNALTAEIYQSHPLIINTTPVGMYPEHHLEPPIDYNLITENHFLFDLIYNPETTRFLQHGLEKGATVNNGYDMLVYQAEKSWEIWKAV